jgi:hypothetical protein
MLYIIKTFDSYYVQAGETSWNEIHDPNFATTFSSKKKAETWMKEHTTFAGYAKYLPRTTEVTDYNERMKVGIVRRTLAYVDNSFSRPYNKEKDTPMDVLDWRYKYKDEGSEVRSEDYSTWPDLSQLFKHLMSVESYFDSKREGTLRTFQIKVAPNSTFAGFIKELRFIIDKIELIDNPYDGYKMIKIFDHNLSEYDTYFIHYKNDDDVKVCGSRHILTHCAGNIEKVFDYIKQNLYYD